MVRIRVRSRGRRSGHLRAARPIMGTFTGDVESLNWQWHHIVFCYCSTIDKGQFCATLCLLRKDLWRRRQRQKRVNCTTIYCRNIEMALSLNFKTHWALRCIYRGPAWNDPGGQITFCYHAATLEAHRSSIPLPGQMRGRGIWNLVQFCSVLQCSLCVLKRSPSNSTFTQQWISWSEFLPMRTHSWSH